METDKPIRKTISLQAYDYASNGAYFVTICTQGRLPLFGSVIDNMVALNEAVVMAGQRLENISNGIDIVVDKYVVMPNHIHAIMMISRNGTAQGPFPTLSEYIRRFKTITTKLYIDGVKDSHYPPFDKVIWQKSFHDRILRDENEYLYCVEIHRRESVEMAARSVQPVGNGPVPFH